MKNNKWFIAVNPISGGDKGKKHWKTISTLLEQMGIEFDYVFSESKGHIISLVQKAIENGYRKIIGVGGDGTAHEIVNGICSQQVVSIDQITFALIPVGTGNDWIRTHKIPNNYKKAILLIQAGKTVKQDIGYLTYHTLDNNMPESRYFINVAGLGYEAFVAKAVERKKSWLADKLLSNYLLLSAALMYRARWTNVQIGDEIREMELYSMSIGVCRYNAGGVLFVPHAVYDDGYLASTLIGKLGIREVFRHAYRFYNGKIEDHPKVTLSKAKHIHVEALYEKLPTLVEADGEFLGQTPATFSVLEQQLNVIVP